MNIILLGNKYSVSELFNILLEFGIYHIPYGQNTIMADRRWKLGIISSA
jgi:hypothetical protein